MEPHPPDLTKEAPRSPRERMGGVAHLPRMLDKARARAAGRLGEYIYPCPMDRRVLTFLELDPEAFADAAAALSDAEMEGWVEAHAAHRDETDRSAFSEGLLTLGPGDDESRAAFAAQVAALGPRAQGARSWADLIDREEGR
jgi:Domain of unknown function (DUF5069)